MSRGTLNLYNVDEVSSITFNISFFNLSLGFMAAKAMDGWPVGRVGG